MHSVFTYQRLFFTQQKPLIKSLSGEVRVHRCVYFTICTQNKSIVISQSAVIPSRFWTRLSRVYASFYIKFFLVDISWDKKKPPCLQGTTPQGTGEKCKVSLGLTFFFCSSRNRLSYPAYYQSTSDPAAFF